MIIFGTRGVTTTPEKGEFHCPTCNSVQPYGLKRVRRFFTLYFIPVIPLGKLGEYVECGTCRDTYKTSVLEYRPSQDNADTDDREFQAAYHTAIRKILIQVLLADGAVEDSEIEMAQKVYNKVTATECDAAAFRQEIAQAQRQPEDLATVLRPLQGMLNDEGKELTLKAAIYVAKADGTFHDHEQALISRIGSDLGMTQAHVHGVLSSS